MQLTCFLFVIVLAVFQHDQSEAAPQEEGVQMQTRALRKFLALSLLAGHGHGEKLGDVWSDCSKAHDIVCWNGRRGSGEGRKGGQI